MFARSAPWSDGPIFLKPDKVIEWVAKPWFPMRFLTNMPQPSLEAYPVSRRIKSRDADDYRLLDKVDPVEDAIASTGFDDELEEDD